MLLILREALQSFTVLAEYLIKEIEAAKAIMLEDKIVDWLLDKKPTIFDKKTLIIATGEQECLMEVQ